MTLTEEQIREILAGCEGVSEGPWKTHPVDDTSIINSSGRDVATTCDSSQTEREDSYDVEYERMEKDASHIARCDPDTIRNLCELALDGLRMREFLADEDNATDEIEEAISDSFDIDWTASIGARSVFRLFKALLVKG